MFKKTIAITGMPRSGTSWIGMIFDSSPRVRYRLSPLFSYEFKNRIDESSPVEDWDEVLQGAYASDNEFMNQTRRRDAGEYPIWEQKDPEPDLLVIKFNRFHNLLERMLALYPELKMLAIVRHPCGAIHSWLTAAREFPPDADPLEHWRSGDIKKSGYGDYFGFDDWKWATRLHMRLAAELPDRFCLQSYEQLVRDPVGGTRRLFEKFGIAYTQQTARFLEQSHARHEAGDYAVFKHPSVKDRWRSELQPEIRDAIHEELRGTDLEPFLED